jgi:Transglycosylase SLT domain
MLAARPLRTGRDSSAAQVKQGPGTVDVQDVEPQPSRRRPGRSLAAIGVSLTFVFGAGASAHAETADQANAQAEQLAVAIGKLQPGVDSALAAYDSALAAVGQAVSSGVVAEHAYKILQARADDLVMQQNSHIVALYKTGGSLALYAAALQSGRPSDLEQVPYFSGIVTSDVQARASAVRVADAAKASLDATQAQIDSGLDNADAVDQRLGELQNVLAQQQALLDQASGRAKSLQALKDAAAALDASRIAAAQAGAQAADSVAPYPIPPNFRALYQAAAQTCPGLPWTVLAAIGQVETHHGSGAMLSSAGALGPMQFMAPTFMRYARDGNGDGLADIMNPADAIYSAAAYLCANGAGTSARLSSAVWNYNHADWYVQLVLSLAAKIT